MALLEKAVDTLARTGTLPAAYRPHKLSGGYEGAWECHLKGDWLLVWEQSRTCSGYAEARRRKPKVIRK